MVNAWRQNCLQGDKLLASCHKNVCTNSLVTVSFKLQKLKDQVNLFMNIFITISNGTVMYLFSNVDYRSFTFIKIDQNLAFLHEIKS